MKKVDREIIVHQHKTVFVSNDGKEFDSEEACIKWESSYKSTLEASIKNIKKIDVSAVDLGLPWGSDDHEVWLVCPSNLDEIILLNAYIKCETHDMSASTITTDMIGKYITMNWGYDRDFCDVIPLEKHYENINRYVDEIMRTFENTTTS